MHEWPVGIARFGGTNATAHNNPDNAAAAAAASFIRAYPATDSLAQCWPNVWPPCVLLLLLLFLFCDSCRLKLVLFFTVFLLHFIQPAIYLQFVQLLSLSLPSLVLPNNNVADAVRLLCHCCWCYRQIPTLMQMLPPHLSVLWRQKHASSHPFWLMMQFSH